MLKTLRYELTLWVGHLLKSIPGRTGVLLRNLLLPYEHGAGVRVWDNVHLDHPSRLRVGDNTSISRGTIINCSGYVNIGSNVLIGPNVTMYSQNHIFEDRSKLIVEQGYVRKKPVIEDDVWIASNVVILPGVTVGKGAVIAGGSIVTKNVPPYAICAGSPAKPIRYRTYGAHDDNGCA